MNKIDDLLNQLRDLDKLKIEYENLKLQNLKEMNELESKFNVSVFLFQTLNFQNSQKYNEEVSKLKEKLSSVEHELYFIKRENKRLEVSNCN